MFFFFFFFFLKTNISLFFCLFISAATIKSAIMCRDDPEVCVKTLYNAGDHQRWQMNEINKLIWGHNRTYGLMHEEDFNRTVQWGYVC